jgi:hypothetical protein
MMLPRRNLMLRYGARLLAFAALGLTAAAAPASAAVTKAGGLRYVSKLSEVAPTSGRGLKAHCPKDTHVWGGGIYNSGSYDSLTVLHSFPYDDGDRKRKPDDGWKARFISSDQVYAYTYAICAKPMPKYEQLTLELGSGPSRHALEPTCESGMNVLSGGTRGSDNVIESEGYPAGSVDNRDRWHLTVDNVNSTDSTFVAIAVCADRDVSYPSAGETVLAQKQKSGSADCVAGRHVVGGGVDHNGQLTDLMIAASSPISAPVTNDQWRVFLDNHNSTTALSFTVYAACVPPLGGP